MKKKTRKFTIYVNVWRSKDIGPYGGMEAQAECTKEDIDRYADHDRKLRLGGKAHKLVIDIPIEWGKKPLNRSCDD